VERRRRHSQTEFGNEKNSQILLRNGHEITSSSQSQNQTWQVQKKTCQVKTYIKIKFGCAFDLPGLVLTWQVFF
jgi:hypothetical protein